MMLRGVVVGVHDVKGCGSRCGSRCGMMLGSLVVGEI